MKPSVMTTLGFAMIAGCGSAHAVSPAKPAYCAALSDAVGLS